MTVGELIRKARKEKGLTQRELGERSNIAEPTIRRYELGKLTPKLNTITKIAAAMNLTASDLIPREQWSSVDTRVSFDIENAPEEELIGVFRSLNSSGKSKALERVEEIAEIPRYRKSD